MPSRVTIYCKRTVDPVDDATISSAIDDADLYSMAEDLDLPEGEEAAVDAMLEHLVVRLPEVMWMPAMRPLQIDVHVGDFAQTIVAEQLEELAAEDDDTGVTRIRDHLAATVVIVSIEGHLDAPQRLDGVLADVIAYHYAEVGDGLIDFYGTSWESPAQPRVTLWQPCARH